MRILVDMNLSPRWVDALQDAGHVAVHWRDLGPGNASDGSIAACARSEAWIVMTRDLDFAELLILGGYALPSVLQIRAEKVSPERTLGPVLAALTRCEQELESGALVTLEPDKGRLRILSLPAGPGAKSS